LPTRIEVLNYLIWRQQDAVRDSIQVLAQSIYSHKELNNKYCNHLQEMCFQKGHNWNDTKTKYKRGTSVYKQEKDERSYWHIDEEIPTFTENREFLENLIINNI
jgi:tRNA(His) 5'-end guanylyltransferase